MFEVPCHGCVSMGIVKWSPDEKGDHQIVRELVLHDVNEVYVTRFQSRRPTHAELGAIASPYTHGVDASEKLHWL